MVSGTINHSLFPPYLCTVIENESHYTELFIGMLVHGIVIHTSYSDLVMIL